MSTTQQLTVYKSYPTEITIKADGYNDYKTTKTFTTDDETVNIPSKDMTVYDGLNYLFETLISGAYLIDFTGTVFPDYGTPSTNMYVMNTAGQTYPVGSVVPNITNYSTATVNNGIISNITQQMDTPQIILYKDKSFEIIGKVHTANVSGIQEIFVAPDCFLLRNSGNDWNPCFYVNGSWQQTNSYGCQSGFDYYIRCRYFPETTVVDGKTYQANTIYFATGAYSGGTLFWQERFNYSLATYFFGDDASVTSQTFNMTVGSQNGVELWMGSIDLNECYVKVDNQFVWKGMDKEKFEGCLVNYTDDGSAVTLNAYQTGTSIILTPDVSYAGIKLGTVTVPEHTVSGE